VTPLRPSRAAHRGSGDLFPLLIGIASSAPPSTRSWSACDQVRFAWTAASRPPTGYLVSRSLNVARSELRDTVTSSPSRRSPCVRATRSRSRWPRPATTARVPTAPAAVDDLRPRHRAARAGVLPLGFVAAALRDLQLGADRARCGTHRSCSRRRQGLASPWRVLGTREAAVRPRPDRSGTTRRPDSFAVYDGQFLAPITSLAIPAARAAWRRRGRLRRRRERGVRRRSAPTRSA
jgi:hypothetical protein